MRNQCAQIIGYYLGEVPDCNQNSEAWLAREVLAPSCTSFIDVGAHVGDWSAAFMAGAPEHAQGLLFEPDSRVLPKLRARFSENPRVRILPLAVSNVAGVAVFHEEPDNRQGSSLTAAGHPEGTLATRVSVTTLDDEVERCGWERVDVVKIDAEGYDFHVLLGARRLLRARRVGVVQFEYSPGWAWAGSTLAAALAFLRSAGYHVYLLKDRSLYELDYPKWEEYGRYSNYVAVSPETSLLLAPLVKGQI